MRGILATVGFVGASVLGPVGLAQVADTITPAAARASSFTCLA